MRRGQPVAALVRIPPEALEDFLLAYAPELIESRREADAEVARGETRLLSSLFAKWDTEDGGSAEEAVSASARA